RTKLARDLARLQTGAFVTSAATQAVKRRYARWEAFVARAHEPKREERIADVVATRTPIAALWIYECCTCTQLRSFKRRVWKRRCPACGSTRWLRRLDLATLSNDITGASASARAARASRDPLAQGDAVSSERTTPNDAHGTRPSPIHTA